MADKRNILVLGASGKLGRHVVRELLNSPLNNILPYTLSKIYSEKITVMGKEFTVLNLGKDGQADEKMARQLFAIKKEWRKVYVVDCTTVLQSQIARIFAAPPLSFPTLVLGTIGKNDPENEEILRSMAEEYGPGFLLARCTNAAVGLNGLVNSLSAMQDFLRGATAHIYERHHVSKLEKPSGYAKAIGGVLYSAGCGVRYRSCRCEEDLPAKHRVTISKDGQKITLETEVKDRSVYAKGAVGTFLQKLIAAADSKVPYGLFDW